ncbi:hypothetical protein BEWA_022310 [Theileria equi strain WA]|uniref:Uncharacterized protein n=1 Tax=Theileria equi strain WA TaxID=1537102 RepID=L0AVY9_THEEQ|nr:hypothetical protein BEWA_022310 [Theileria equi strain WA]AFZ79383.1 hypothetical protein BEWA_022310 [Theileria equi strain WA]|eukprot:XP_004829049.1 hypothetical protein BEWA_022310 [Theileria equi strain WA]
MSDTQPEEFVERGLFEDTDESEDEPTEEPTEVVHQTMKCKIKPELSDNLTVCKFPPTLSVSTLSIQEELERLKRNPELVDKPPNTTKTIRWRKKEDESIDGDSEMESNTHLVEWDDGTFTLFVGKTPLDVESRKEIVFLLEDSLEELKPVHALIEERLQTRFSNLLKKELIRKKPDVRRQKMALTSISEAISSELSLQKQMVLMRENERLRKIQQGSMVQRGLTRTFLESDSDEEMQ